MTPEEYIKQLKNMRRSLKHIENNIDSAIYNMERRLETGYEICETSSKIDVKYAFEGATNNGGRYELEPKVYGQGTYKKTNSRGTTESS